MVSQGCGAGRADARLELGQMYLDGKGVEVDYVQAAHWFGCPKLDERLLSACDATAYFDDFPQGARNLLVKMGCDTEGAVGNSPSGFQLADGTPAYQVCCRDFHRDPCEAVLIGKIGSQWKDLTAKGDLRGFGKSCRVLLPLESQHYGVHDLCVPSQCGPAKPGEKQSCLVWRFKNGRYHGVVYTPQETPH